MRYRLRTLLILLAVGPPALAGVWFLAQHPLGVVVLVMVVYFLASFVIGPPPDRTTY
jgi:hypothetical protein